MLRAFIKFVAGVSGKMAAFRATSRFSFQFERARPANPAIRKVIAA
jgi:hypothetical protein